MKTCLGLIWVLLLGGFSAGGQTSYYYQYPNPVRLVREQEHIACAKAHVMTRYRDWGSGSYHDTTSYSKKGQLLRENSTVFYSYSGDTLVKRTYARPYSPQRGTDLTVEKTNGTGKLFAKYKGLRSELRSRQDSLQLPGMVAYNLYDKYGSLIEEKQEGAATGRYRLVYQKKKLKDIYYATDKVPEYLYEQLYYDDRGRFAGFDSYQNGKKTGMRISYDAIGNLQKSITTTETSTEETTYQYNQARQLLSATTVSGKGSVDSLTYTYNEHGLLSSWVVVYGGTESLREAYRYTYY